MTPDRGATDPASTATEGHPSVTMLSTPDDGTCGIGTYAGDLVGAFPAEVGVSRVIVPLGSPNPLPYVLGAIRAGMTDDDVIHVQHEYGIYGPKSVWSWLCFPILFVLAALRHRPVVLTLHSAWSDATIGPPLVASKRVYVAGLNRLLAHADQLVFLSPNARETFAGSVPVPNSVVLPHGVQVEPRNLDAVAAKERFHYRPEDPLVVEPGYLRPEKGQDVLLEIARELPDVNFLIAGGSQDDDYAAEIRDSAPANVQVTGILEDDAFHAAFVAADLCVLPYTEVTQSGIFNWCVAYERPVLGSDAAYFEHLAAEWDCVRTVAVDDPAAAAAVIEELLGDDAAREALAAAMAEYRAANAMDVVGERHRELYETLAV